MSKLKIGMVVFVMLCISTLKAQTIEQGKKYLIAERFESAKAEFQKLLSLNPNNEEAIYWLGQAMIRPEELSSKSLQDAKSLYQTKLSISNSQLLMAGIGHVELLEGKTQDARNHFDAAISLSQGKNIAVLNAIGFANGNPDAKNGDVAFAIDKLTLATQLKKFNDPDVWVNLGDAYRKNDNGGKALESYNSALQIDPKYARANYRIGKLYQSQGKGQESIFMEHYNNAIANDPQFAPVYANLFNYYYETNVAKAADYFEKWLANSDKDYKTCYYTAALKYAQGFFMEAISQADGCIAAEGTSPYPNLYGLKANAYNRLKDSVNAVSNYAEYIKRQVPEKITAGDIIEYAKNLFKIPGNEVQAGLLVDKAVAMDSIEQNKIQYLKTVAQSYESKKNFIEAAAWYNKIISVKKNPTKFDYNTTAFNYYKGGAYQQSIELFTKSLEKFPGDPYAYNLIGKASWAIDTTLQLGMANTAFEKTIEFGSMDSVKYKPQLMTAYKYFVAYNANIKKDKDLAISFADKALALDPTDAEALNYKAVLTSPAPKSKAKEPVKKP